MYKKILKFAWPIIFGNILQTVYQMTDLFWIGRYSTEGVAAISLAWPVIFFFISLGIGLTIAGTIMVAQARGGKRFEQLNHIVGQTITITIIYSIVASIIGYFTAPIIIWWMDASNVVKDFAIGYLEISFVGMLAVFGYMALQSLWRWMGEVIKPVYIVIGTALLNLILDPLFIMWWWPIQSMGVNGAARSTLITQFIALVIGMYLMYRSGKYHLNFYHKNFKIRKGFIKQYFWLAIPSSIEMSARSLGMVVLATIVASLGTITTAAYGVGNQLFSIVLFVALWFSMAATTLAWQLYGAKDYDWLSIMREKTLVMTFWVLLLLGIVIFILAKPIVSIFVPWEMQVITESVRFVKIIALSLWTIGIQQIYIGMFRGLGEVHIPMALTMITLWIIQIPTAYWWSKYYESDAIWRSLPIANSIVMLISILRYHHRKNKKITSIQSSSM